MFCFVFLPLRYEWRETRSPQSQFLSPGRNILPGGDRQPRPSSTAVPWPRFPLSRCSVALRGCTVSRSLRSASPRRDRVLLPRAEGMTGLFVGLEIPRRGRAEIGRELPQLPRFSRCFADGHTEISIATHRPSPFSPDGPGAALARGMLRPHCYGTEISKG